MTRATALVLALGALANPTAWATEMKPQIKTPNGKVIVTFKAATKPEVRQEALAKLGVVSLREILSQDSGKQIVVVVAQAPGAPLGAPRNLAALKELDGSIVNVEEDYSLNHWIMGMPSFQETRLPGGSLRELGLSSFKKTPLSASLAAFSPAGEFKWGVLRVKAPAAWDYTEGAGVRVAVIDTGVDFEHGELSGKVDGGFNAITGCEGLECSRDDNGHGTHVAGIIAAKRDGFGVVGVAPRARLYSVKVLDKEGSGSLSDVIKGIIWAADNGMQVANMSLGSPFPSESMQRALRYAKAMGVVVVAAAGNSGAAVGYPGAYPEVIAVSASDENNKITGFSSRGTEVDFIAPGDAIVSTYLGGGLANLRGTSMAAPHVAGLAALAVSQGAVGMDGPDGVMRQLSKAAKSIGLAPTEQGVGMIDAWELTHYPLPPRGMTMAALAP